jgi:adenine phosphoribosyltransferase
MSGEYRVKLSDDMTIALPLVKVNEEFSIYSFNMMGKASWNREAAKSLYERIKAAGMENDFDALITAESKAIALTEVLAGLFGMDRYVVLRKSVKAYMEDPIDVETKSITTAGVQHLYLDRLDLELIKGKKVLVVDDVISTGGTLDSIMQVSEKGCFDIALIACVLTEGSRRSEYHDIPMLSLDHIPLP